MLDAFYDEVMTRFEFYLGAKKEEVQSFTSDGKLVKFSAQHGAWTLLDCNMVINMY